ncbi:hypothetical protein A2U01_0099720, partial [Trifolium medium]|nr:hypothetical protein [Trifolium medium]
TITESFGDSSDSEGATEEEEAQGNQEIGTVVVEDSQSGERKSAPSSESDYDVETNAPSIKPPAKKVMTVKKSSQE